jgi:aspartyl-tRNA(Asn)/glutamyl-tRNA(Gln) amidotransferase subunit C
MALTIEEVRKIASLARLRIAPAEEALFASQLDRIVGYIDQLSRFSSAAPRESAEVSQQADDRAEPCLPRGLFLGNAPKEMDGFLLVPDVKGGTEDV